MRTGEKLGAEGRGRCTPLPSVTRAAPILSRRRTVAPCGHLKSCSSAVRFTSQTLGQGASSSSAPQCPCPPRPLMPSLYRLLIAPVSAACCRLRTCCLSVLLTLALRTVWSCCTARGGRTSSLAPRSRSLAAQKRCADPSPQLRGGGRLCTCTAFQLDCWDAAGSIRSRRSLPPCSGLDQAGVAFVGGAWRR